jgi:dTDP-4-amino-4,6-dideoxygalactose transaminase
VGPQCNWQSYAVCVDRGRQRAVMQRLLDGGVATRRGVMNAHLEGAYPAGAWRAAGSLRLSEEAQDRAIILPLFHQLDEADQDVVIDAVKRAVA